MFGIYGILSPTDNTDFCLRFFATLKILFCLGKSLTYNKIRSFAMQNRSTDLHRFYCYAMFC